MLTDHQAEQVLREAVREWQQTDAYDGLSPATKELVGWLANNAEVNRGEMTNKTAEIMRTLTIGSTIFEATNLSGFISHSIERAVMDVLR